MYIHMGNRKSDLNKLINISLTMYMFSLFFFNGTIIFYIASAFFVATSIIKVLFGMKFRLGTIGIIMLFFLAYNLFLILGGNVYLLSRSLQRFIILIMNFIIHILIMNHLISSSNRYFFIRKYVLMSVVFSVFIMILNYKSLFNSRLAFGLSYPFGFNGMYNPNTIGISLGIAILFCLLLYHQSKRRKYVVLISFFIIVIIMLGSRKALIFGGLGIPLVLILNKNSFTGKFKNIIFSLISVLAVLLMIFNIPILYDLIGERMLDAINGYLFAGEFTESAAFHRNQMILIAKDLITKNTFLGYGLDSFTLLSPYVTYSHHNYYELWVGIGLPGVMLYYSSYAFLLLKLIKRTKLRNIENTIYLVFILMMILMDLAMVSYTSREITFMFFVINAFIINQNQTEYNDKDNSISEVDI